MAAIELNFTNFTNEGLIRAPMVPYLTIFGNLLWGILFGFIGGAVYANERSLGTSAAYLILVGAFMAFILPVPIIAIFGLLLAFIVAVILYITFVTMRSE